MHDGLQGGTQTTSTSHKNLGPVLRDRLYIMKPLPGKPVAYNYELYLKELWATVEYSLVAHCFWATWLVFFSDIESYVHPPNGPTVQ